MIPSATTTPTAAVRTGPVWPVLIAISACHMINDVLQSLLSAIYPLLRDEFTLSYAQIGWMTFALQVTASLLQPVVGIVTDRHPMPKSLALGMLSSFAGVLTLAQAVALPRLVADPKGKAVWYSALGVGLYVTGMMITAFAIRP